MPQLPNDRSPDVSSPAHATLDLAALQRRRALLSGLGKGSATVAALVPLASRASSRDRVVFNAALNGNGYCSVSGFQSAAISSAPGAAVCAAKSPADFFAAADGTYTDKPNGENRKRRGIKDALALAPFSVMANNVQADALAIAGGKARIGSKVFLAGDHTLTGGTFKELKASGDFPTTVISPVMNFNAAGFMGAGPANTVLEELFLNSNNAYFAAAFLTCVKEDGAVTSSAGFDAGSLPFDAAYVRDQYQNNQVEAAVFFKALSPV